MNDSNVLEFVDRKTFEKRKILNRLHKRLANKPKESETIFPTDELSYAERQLRIEELRMQKNNELREQFKKK